MKPAKSATGGGYVIFGAPKIEQPEIDEVLATLRSGWLGTGPKVAQFEKLVARHKRVKHAIAVNSCTAGLHLSCLAVELGKGDEVIVPAMTFCATVNAVIHAGATPVLAEVRRDTLNIDPADVIRKISPRTKAILPVHFAGRPCDMHELEKIAREYRLTIIEDCAHAIESEYQGRSAGSFGKCGVLSFYSTKNVVTGEGGMILTDDDDLAARLKRLALHGMSQDAWSRFSDDGYKHYNVVEIGYKYNMMDLQAAIGIHQIQRVEQYWKTRRQIWNRYNQEFADLPIELPAPVEAHTRHAFHLYTILILKDALVTRDEFIVALHRRGIGTGVHYRALPVHPVYQEMFGWKPADYPTAHAIGESTVSLPLSAKLSAQDIDRVVRNVREVLRGE